MAEANSEGSKTPEFKQQPLFSESGQQTSSLEIRIIDPSTGIEIKPTLLTPGEAREDRARENELLYGTVSQDQRKAFWQAKDGDKRKTHTGPSLDDIANQRDEHTGETVLERADRMPGSGQESGRPLRTESVVAKVKAAR